MKLEYAMIGLYLIIFMDTKTNKFQKDGLKTMNILMERQAVEVYNFKGHMLIKIQFNIIHLSQILIQKSDQDSSQLLLEINCYIIRKYNQMIRKIIQKFLILISGLKI
ncbi:unnamed protein product [Paramecium primaurelia]|uniref:Uncharacterized protein n=1 Tax=Paramecium primaurelia TaxID=5886 RepID=A0A8S1JTR8_PARPR|nr:unnamed protein product [Paramecium primaurelia]